jgi:hypothetical protein
MKKTLLFAFGNLVLAMSYAQSVGIGTTTPLNTSKLHVKGLNTSSNFAAIIDGDTLGTALQVPRGGVSIGTYAPISRLFVATDLGGKAPIDSFAAIVGYSISAPSAVYGGVYGTYNQNVYGVGVQGVGYGGIEYVDFFGSDVVDVGVHGSATIGVSAIGSAFGLYAEAADLTEETATTQYAVFASTANGTAETQYAGYFDGNVSVVGNLDKGSGTFKIDNPIDPANKYLYHSFVESPDMMNIYNGNITTDGNGLAIVTMPAYFDALNKEFRYQLTAIGTFAQAIVKDELNDNRFTIQTNQPNVKVSWQVTGVRKDKYAEANRVQVEVEKEPWNKGFFLHAKEFGLDKSKSIPHRAALKLSTAAPGFTQQGATTKPSTVVKKTVNSLKIGNRKLVVAKDEK